MMNRHERLDRLTDLACEAWEATTGHVVNASRGEKYEHECLVGFRSAARERLEEGVKAWTDEIHERELACQAGGYKIGVLHAIHKVEDLLGNIPGDEETPEWEPVLRTLLKDLRTALRVAR